MRENKLRIPYYPGCTLKANAKNFEVSALHSMEKLGIEMIELPRWNCCGVVESLTADDKMRHLAPVRNLIRVEEMNEAGIVDDEFRLLTLCSMCFNTLKRSNKFVREDQENLDLINDFMYQEPDYQGKVEVIHLFELLADRGFSRITEKIEKKLEKLNVAAYYGCMLLRPRNISIDDAENPNIIENFVSALGANPVNWHNKHRCCGSYHTLSNKQLVVDSVKEIIQDAQKNRAEIIITSCPLCAFNLDQRQKEIKEQDDNFRQMPILYFTQLLALALGLGKESFGFDQNYIDPEPVLKRFLE